MRSLYHESSLALLKPAQPRGTGNVVSLQLDIQDFGAARYILAAGRGAEVQLQQRGPDDGWTDTAGATVTTTDEASTVVIDLTEPMARYSRVVVKRSKPIAVGEIYGLLTSPRRSPVEDAAGVVGIHVTEPERPFPG